jgi:hypothetical protein
MGYFAAKVNAARNQSTATNQPRFLATIHKLATILNFPALKKAFN